MIDFEKILSGFCYYTLGQGMISISYEQLISNTNKTKNYFTNFHFKDEDFINDLIQSVCLIAQEGFNYQFVHRSFQEYFCAKFITNIIPEEKVEKVLRNFSMKMDLKNVFYLINDIKSIYIEKHYILPIIKEIEQGISTNKSISKFVGNHIITSIRISAEKNFRISFMGSHDGYFYLGDILYIAEYYKKNSILEINDRDGLVKNISNSSITIKNNEYKIDCSQESFDPLFNKHLVKLKKFFDKDIILIKKKIQNKIKKQNKFIEDLL